MNIYRIIGNDGREYGPADLATMRAWVAESRIDSNTLIQADGSTEWKTASAFPELEMRAPASSPPILPKAPTSPASKGLTPSAKPDPENARIASGSRKVWAVSTLAVIVIVFVAVAMMRLATEEESSLPMASRPAPVQPPEVGSPAAAPGESTHSPEEQQARQAAEQGNPEAQYRLGVLYATGRGVVRNYSEAARWYRKAADQGHTQAQYELGRLYAQGLGVSRDDTEAAKWYRLAAEKEYTPAQHLLGHLYANGQGLEMTYLEVPEPPRNEPERASAGAALSRSDYAEAAKWWRKAADQGDAAAQSDLAWLYTNGRGVETNHFEAVKWYRKSAEQGYALAQHWLGHNYLTGQGVDKDEAEALKWFHQAAENGNVSAQGDLGRAYAAGQGVEQNSSEAVKWYRKAADAGYPTIQNDFAWMLATSPNPGLRNGVLAVEYAKKAVAATQRKHAGFLDTLAAAYAEAGDFDQAVVIQKESIALLRDANSKQDYTSRLKLYETKAPYRERKPSSE